MKRACYLELGQFFNSQFVFLTVSLGRILVACGTITTIAYILLFYAQVTPVISLVMLAIVVSFMPTIMKSSVPNLVNPAVYGSAKRQLNWLTHISQTDSCTSLIASQFDSFFCVIYFSSLAYGAYVIAESFGSVVGNLAVGALRDETHNWDLDILIFAGMAAVAVVLTLLLIFLDHMNWAGLGAGGHALGGLNDSSFKAAKEYDRAQRRKDLYLAKEHQRRKQERARSINTEEGDIVAAIGPYQAQNKV